ncbi:cytochrome c family protein [Kineobactrum salinum]|uniref:Cytochrome c domain-containing protein n=1 Tax=Kineobactrum salinum TaxID=2708301 RepID=A0A6C0TZM2_9GAMM|nr:cytochrome c [Kineobactrum salinum]QIB64983.1 hypothetical protein G3T16_05795 [Kineobactrum salinum]
MNSEKQRSLIHLAIRNLVIAIMVLISLAWFAGMARAGDSGQLVAAGKEIYERPGSCATCHLADGSGNSAMNAKDLRFGPSPFDIHQALTSVPQMGPIGTMLKLDKEGLLALALYIHTLGEKEINSDVLADLRRTLTGITKDDRDAGFELTERDKMIDQISSFDTVIETWKRKAKSGNIKHGYETVVVNTWEPGKPKFKPQRGKTYFYLNTGNRGDMFGQGFGNGAGNAVTVGDAETLEVIAQGRLEPELRGSVHATGMTPDGRYGYIIGPSIKTENSEVAAEVKGAKGPMS